MAEGWTRVAAYGIVLDREDRILLAHYRGGPDIPPVWTLPGGGVDFGEALVDAARREIEEESGLVCEIGPVLDVTDELFDRKDERQMHASACCLPRHGRLGASARRNGRLDRCGRMGSDPRGLSASRRRLAAADPGAPRRARAHDSTAPPTTQPPNPAARPTGCLDSMTASINP